jgi:hypothetical protein
VIWEAAALQDVRESQDGGGADAAGAGEDKVKSGVEERAYVSSVECLTLVAQRSPCLQGRLSASLRDQSARPAYRSRAHMLKPPFMSGPGRV